jgi:hypothetical protein
MLLMLLCVCERERESEEAGPGPAHIANPFHPAALSHTRSYAAPFLAAVAAANRLASCSLRKRCFSSSRLSRAASSRLAFASSARNRSSRVC